MTLFCVTETFWHNPQYRITLVDPDDEDDDDMCTVIVALMQKNHRSQRKMGMECLTIGFAMYHVRATPNPVLQMRITHQV
jgi:calpain